MWQGLGSWASLPLDSRPLQFTTHGGLLDTTDRHLHSHKETQEEEQESRARWTASQYNILGRIYIYIYISISEFIIFFQFLRHIDSKDRQGKKKKKKRTRVAHQRKRETREIEMMTGLGRHHSRKKSTYTDRFSSFNQKLDRPIIHSPSIYHLYINTRSTASKAQGYTLATTGVTSQSLWNANRRSSMHVCGRNLHIQIIVNEQSTCDTHAKTKALDPHVITRCSTTVVLCASVTRSAQACSLLSSTLLASVSLSGASTHKLTHPCLS